MTVGSVVAVGGRDVGEGTGVSAGRAVAVCVGSSVGVEGKEVGEGVGVDWAHPDKKSAANKMNTVFMKVRFVIILDLLKYRLFSSGLPVALRSY